MSDISIKRVLRRPARVLTWFLLAVAFVPISATASVAPQSEPVFCDACDPSGSGTGNPGGGTAESNVPIDGYYASGAEQYAYLNSSCSDTTVRMDNERPPAGLYDVATYLFQVTDPYGGLIAQESGDVTDVTDANGRITMYTHAVVPQGGSTSLNIHLQNSSTDYNAGILFRGVSSRC